MADADENLQRLDRAAKRPYTRREYAGRAAWRLVELGLIRPSPPRAYRWRRWWLHRFGTTGGGSIRSGVRVWHPWLLELGDWSILDHGVEVYNLGPVTIGEHTVISRGVFLCAGTHDHRRADLPLIRAGITVGRGVWIAAEAFIGPGVTVGDGAVVGARAVVTSDVPPHTIVAGNPARVIGPREMEDDTADGV